MRFGRLSVARGPIHRSAIQQRQLGWVRRNGIALRRHGSELAFEGAVEDGGEEGVELGSCFGL